MPLFIFLSEPDAEQRCAADPDEGGERADHGENGTADADTRERQITDRGNVLMYIRSTMLYRTLTNCASMLGKQYGEPAFRSGRFRDGLQFS